MHKSLFLLVLRLGLCPDALFMTYDVAPLAPIYLGNVPFVNQILLTLADGAHLAFVHALLAFDQMCLELSIHAL